MHMRATRHDTVMAPKKGGKAAKKAGAPASLKAQGGKTKRTPSSSFDAAAGKETYEPEKIIAKRLSFVH